MTNKTWRSRPTVQYLADEGEMFIGLGLYWDFTNVERVIGFMFGPFFVGIEWRKEG
jgi:predicted N-acetyltransferase YhbS